MKLLILYFTVINAFLFSKFIFADFKKFPDNTNYNELLKGGKIVLLEKASSPMNEFPNSSTVVVGNNLIRIKFLNTKGKQVTLPKNLNIFFKNCAEKSKEYFFIMECDFTSKNEIFNKASKSKGVVSFETNMRFTIGDLRKFDTFRMAEFYYDTNQTQD